MEEIQKALNEYNLEENTPISLVRESEDNEVFCIGEKNKKILRISKRLPLLDIQFEYEAIQHLKNRGVVVPVWLKTKANNFYTVVNNRVAVLFDFLEGHHILVDKEHLPTMIQSFNAGRGLGHMSNAAVGFIPSSLRGRNIFSELERVTASSDKFIEQFEGGKDFVEQVRNSLEFGRNKNEIMGFIHNDYRPSNVFFNTTDEVSGIIDLDWSCIGPVVKDLSLAIVEWSFPDGAMEVDFKVFDSFLDGYNSVANNKWHKDEDFYSWIKFATLSDASTYFCDLVNDPNSTKRVIKSYMYRKYLYFSNL